MSKAYLKLLDILLAATLVLMVLAAFIPDEGKSLWRLFSIKFDILLAARIVIAALRNRDE